MSTLAKSVNVCTGCRSRKKKCDGQRPSCQSCFKRGELCFYAGAPSQMPASLDWSSSPGLIGGGIGPNSWDANRAIVVDQLDPSLLDKSPLSLLDDWLGYTADAQEAEQPSKTPSSAQIAPSTPQASTPYLGSSVCLPSKARLAELVDVFFEKFYNYLPMIHRPTFMDKLCSESYRDCSLLILSVIAVAASAHPDRRVQQMQTSWFEEAKSLFSKAVHSPDHPLQTLQAANLIIFQAMLLLEHSTSWMVLGEAWRKALAIGCNVQDQNTSTWRVMPSLGHLQLTHWHEKEECRRAVWTLFILDRGICYPIGLTHAIDDRNLKVNLPMSEGDFQSTMEPAYENPITYTQSLDRLTTSIQRATRNGNASMLQYIILAYVLLGRIGECIYAEDYDYQDQKPQLDSLTSHLLRIRLMLPRFATDLSAAEPEDFAYVVWLNLVMAVSSILLYHRPLQAGESLQDQTEPATNWPHCIAAARSAISTIRDAARASSDIIINPHLSSQLFTCGRILAIEYKYPSNAQRRTTNPGLKNDLEILVATFERMNEAFPAVGKKFRNGLFFYLRENENQVCESKAGGSRDLLKTCGKWPKFDDSDVLSFAL